MTRHLCGGGFIDIVKVCVDAVGSGFLKGAQDVRDDLRIRVGIVGVEDADDLTLGAGHPAVHGVIESTVRPAGDLCDSSLVRLEDVEGAIRGTAIYDVVIEGKIAFLTEHAVYRHLHCSGRIVGNGDDGNGHGRNNVRWASRCCGSSKHWW